jgi:hypothetical protein
VLLFSFSSSLHGGRRGIAADCQHPNLTIIDK